MPVPRVTRALAAPLMMLFVCNLSISPVDAGKIYAGSGPNINRANLDGSDTEVVFAGEFETGVGVWSLDLDLTHGLVYWTMFDSFGSPEEGIYRSDLEGQGFVNLIPGLLGPRAIAVDPAGGKLYWSEDFPLPGRIRRADLDGSNAEDLLVANGAFYMTLDPAGGKMYWTELGSHKVRRANLDGSNAEDLVTLTNGQGIALDLQAGKMYWPDSAADAIRRANLDGSAAESVLMGPDEPGGFALDAVHGKMYWCEAAIRRANLDGSDLEDLDIAGKPALAIFGACGDGTLDTFEECDDGNVDDGDGCQADCVLSECGDGILDDGEQCDDGGTDSCDGCSPVCEIEPGFVCGDGVLNSLCGEGCNDGNAQSCDGCSPACQTETGFVCGDGTMNRVCGELCDDGNNISGDGCDADCTFTQIPAASIRGVALAVALLLFTSTVLLRSGRRRRS